MHCFNLMSTATALAGFIWGIRKYRSEAADEVFNRNMGALQMYALQELGDHVMLLDELDFYFAELCRREEEGLLKPLFGTLAAKTANYRQKNKQLQKEAEQVFPVREHDDSPEDVAGSSEAQEEMAQDAARLRTTLKRRSGEDNVKQNALLDLWWERRTAGDLEARQADRIRRTMKQFFDMAYMTNEHSPARKHRKILRAFLTDHWSVEDVQRFLTQVLPMDKAQYRAMWVKDCDWESKRPLFYDYIAETWNVRESKESAVDLLTAKIELEKRTRKTWDQAPAKGDDNTAGVGTDDTPADSGPTESVSGASSPAVEVPADVRAATALAPFDVPDE